MNIKVQILLIAIMVTVSGCQKLADTDLGGEYKLINSASFNDLTIVTKENIVIIGGHILDYSFDSTFIIASQRPRDSIQGIETLNYNEYEEAFEKCKICKYWIIDKSLPQNYDTISFTYSNVYEPFTKNEYFLKRNEIGVPRNLQLEK